MTPEELTALVAATVAQALAAQDPPDVTINPATGKPQTSRQRRKAETTAKIAAADPAKIADDTRSAMIRRDGLPIVDGEGHVRAIIRGQGKTKDNGSAVKYRNARISPASGSSLTLADLDWIAPRLDKLRPMFDTVEKACGIGAYAPEKAASTATAPVGGAEVIA